MLAADSVTKCRPKHTTPIPAIWFNPQIDFKIIRFHLIALKDIFPPEPVKPTEGATPHHES